MAEREKNEDIERKDEDLEIEESGNQKIGATGKQDVTRQGVGQGQSGGGSSVRQGVGQQQGLGGGQSQGQVGGQQMGGGQGVGQQGLGGGQSQGQIGGQQMGGAQGIGQTGLGGVGGDKSVDVGAQKNTAQRQNIGKMGQQNVGQKTGGKSQGQQGENLGNQGEKNVKPLETPEEQVEEKRRKAS